MDQQSELAKAEAELAGIDAKLADIDRQRAALDQRRSKLRTFVELGRSLFSATSQNPFDGPPALYSPGAVSRAIANEAERQQQRELSMKARILDLSRSAVRMHGPLSTAKLVEHIEATGLAITGKDKNVTVSVILSRSDDFVSDRSRGWSLAAEKTPADAATSPGSSAT